MILGTDESVNRLALTARHDSVSDGRKVGQVVGWIFGKFESSMTLECGDMDQVAWIENN